MNEPLESSVPRPRRLTLTIPSLGGGGAERVAALLVNHWASEDLDVTLITLDSASRDVQMRDPRVTRVGLGALRDSRNLFQALASNAHRLRTLRSAIRASRPDVIVSFLDQMNVLTLLAARGLGVPVVIAERTNPERHRPGRAWSWLRRWTYSWCSALVVQTEQVRKRMTPLVSPRPVVVIPNGVSEPPDRDDSGGPMRQHTIVAVGRLAPEKGFDLLIDAFARVAEQHPSWSVQILGDGPQRAALEQRVRTHGLTGRVLLPGWSSDPWPQLQAADIFVLSSRYEGFPNALLEAMACGLAVVSADCPYGPAEIIRDSVDGVLVPADEVVALASALERLMNDEAERRRLGTAARQVLERFSLAAFFARWDEIVLGGVHSPTIRARAPAGA